MTAFYSVIRFVPDPIRTEYVNVGLMAWSGETLRILMGDGAFTRARCIDPGLGYDDLAGLAAYCTAEITDRWNQRHVRSTFSIDQLVEKPFALSSPAPIDMTAAGEQVDLALDHILARLHELLVNPRPAVRSDPIPALRRPIHNRIKHEIDSGLVKTRVQVTGGVSNKPRELPFMAESEGRRPVPLDVFQARRNQSSDSLWSTADEYCGRLTDLYRSDLFEVVYLYLPSDQRENVHGMAGELVRYLRRSVSSAEVLTRAEDAAQVLLEAVG